MKVCKIATCDLPFRAKGYCQSHWFQQHRHDMKPENYEQMFNDQGGVCAICRLKETSINKGTKQKLSIDHDHITNKIRGLLCGSCNRGIGMFKDNTFIMKQAIAYLS